VPQPEAVELLVLTAIALALALALAPVAASRRALLAKGGVGLAGTAAIALVPTFDLAILVLLAIGVVHAAIDGRRSFAVRLRAPVVAVGLLALAAVFARVGGSDVLHRFAAVGLAAGLAAAVGLLPYLHVFDPDEQVSASPVAWLAYIGPVLAAVVIAYAHGLLSVDAGEAFGAILIALGLVNMAWGSVAAWWTENGAAAWRYSFVADWGLALTGFGISLPDGRRAAILVLFTVVLCRLPLYIASRPSVRDRVVTDRPINLLVAAALAGSAPFAGFAARVLLLRAATQLYWPLALVVAAGMLLWLPASLRLGRSLGVPRGRQAAGVALVLAINVAAGLYPLPLLAAGRL
jgi:NADH:ubiquinone oxidoreductase subunit 2 (subunit N)